MNEETYEITLDREKAHTILGALSVCHSEASDGIVDRGDERRLCEAYVSIIIEIDMLFPDVAKQYRHLYD